MIIVSHYFTPESLGEIPGSKRNQRTRGDDGVCRRGHYRSPNGIDHGNLQGSEEGDPYPHPGRSDQGDTTLSTNLDGATPEARQEALIGGRRERRRKVESGKARPKRDSRDQVLYSRKVD